MAPRGTQKSCDIEGHPRGDRLRSSALPIPAGATQWYPAPPTPAGHHCWWGHPAHPLQELQNMAVTRSLALSLCVQEGVGTAGAVPGTGLWAGTGAVTAAGQRKSHLRSCLPAVAPAAVTPPCPGGSQVRHRGGGRAAITSSAWDRGLAAPAMLGGCIPCAPGTETGTEPPWKQLGI